VRVASHLTTSYRGDALVPREDRRPYVVNPVAYSSIAREKRHPCDHDRHSSIILFPYDTV